MDKPNDYAISTITENEDSRWITVDIDNNKISEAPTPNEAIILAEAVSKDFMLVFVPVPGETYIL